MKPKHFVLISIPCQSAEEMLQAKEAVLFHLETLNPEFSAEGTTLTVKVIPLDPQFKKTPIAPSTPDKPDSFSMT